MHQHQRSRNSFVAIEKNNFQKKKKMGGKENQARSKYNLCVYWKRTDHSVEQCPEKSYHEKRKNIGTEKTMATTSKHDVSFESRNDILMIQKKEQKEKKLTKNPIYADQEIKQMMLKNKPLTIKAQKNINKDQRIFRKCVLKINKKECCKMNALMDTGSTINMISAESVKGLQRKKTRVIKQAVSSVMKSV
jgi:hypothetical protein